MHFSSLIHRKFQEDSKIVILLFDSYSFNLKENATDENVDVCTLDQVFII